MSKIPSALVTVIILFSSFFSIFFVEFSDNVVGSSGDPFYIWIPTDLHFGSINTKYQGSPNATIVFNDMIYDAEHNFGFQFDMAFIPGDITQNGYEAQYQDFVTCFSSLDYHNRADFYCCGGNHDAWGSISYYQQYVDPEGDNSASSGVINEERPFPVENITADERCYTVTVGNTVFVIMSNDWDDDDLYPDTTWWTAIVNDVPSDMNIIGISHHWVEGSQSSIYDSNVGGISNSVFYSSWMASNYGRIDAWFNGHGHWDHSQSGYNEVYVDTDAWGTYQCMATGLNDGGSMYTAAKSIILKFIEGDKDVQVYDYYHGYSSFNYHNNDNQWESGSLQDNRNSSFILDNNFELEGGTPGIYDPPVINSMGYIIGQTQHSGPLGDANVTVDSFWVNFSYDPSGIFSYANISFYDEYSCVTLVDTEYIYWNNPGDGYINCTLYHVTERVEKMYMRVKVFYD